LKSGAKHSVAVSRTIEAEGCRFRKNVVQAGHRGGSTAVLTGFAFAGAGVLLNVVGLSPIENSPVKRPKCEANLSFFAVIPRR
jgi:hypothetical protein